MSAINYYLSKGYSPMNKTVTISGPDTVTVWAPVTGNRVILTGLNVVANQKGTIVFWRYDTNLDNSQTRFAAFSMPGSATIAPSIGCVEGTMLSGSFFARTLGNTTDGWLISLTGFEDGAI